MPAPAAARREVRGEARIAVLLRLHPPLAASTARTTRVKASVPVTSTMQVRPWWPEHPTKSFFPGKAASCVMGVRNTGSTTFNVTYAMAHLASPYNESMNLFNFTGAVREPAAAPFQAQRWAARHMHGARWLPLGRLHSACRSMAGHHRGLRGCLPLCSAARLHLGAVLRRAVPCSSWAT